MHSCIAIRESLDGFRDRDFSTSSLDFLEVSNWAKSRLFLRKFIFWLDTNRALFRERSGTYRKGTRNPVLWNDFSNRGTFPVPFRNKTFVPGSEQAERNTEKKNLTISYYICMNFCLNFSKFKKKIIKNLKFFCPDSKNKHNFSCLYKNHREQRICIIKYKIPIMCLWFSKFWVNFYHILRTS